MQDRPRSVTFFNAGDDYVTIEGTSSPFKTADVIIKQNKKFEELAQEYAKLMEAYVQRTPTPKANGTKFNWNDPNKNVAPDETIRLTAIVEEIRQLAHGDIKCTLADAWLSIFENQSQKRTSPILMGMSG